MAQNFNNAPAKPRLFVYLQRRTRWRIRGSGQPAQFSRSGSSWLRPDVAHRRHRDAARRARQNPV